MFQMFKDMKIFTDTMKAEERTSANFEADLNGEPKELIMKNRIQKGNGRLMKQIKQK